MTSLLVLFYLYHQSIVTDVIIDGILIDVTIDGIPI